MQLWYAPTSPFARKVRITILELGLQEAIELVEVNPWTDGKLRALNPLAKVPTLVRDGAEPLYESGVICDFLNSLSGAGHLIPAAGEARWRALLLQGLADGACTAAGRLFADERRPENERSEGMMVRFQQAIGATLDALGSRPLADGLPTIGEISIAAFLSYLDFRWPGHPWRDGRPQVAAWFERAAERPSMTGTAYRLA